VVVTDMHSKTLYKTLQMECYTSDMELVRKTCICLPCFRVHLFLVQVSCTKQKAVQFHAKFPIQWVTSLFDLAFRWAFRSAKVRSKSRLQSKSEVILLIAQRKLRSKSVFRPKFPLSESLSKRLNENYGLNTDLDPSLAELTWLQSVEFAWKR